MSNVQCLIQIQILIFSIYFQFILLSSLVFSGILTAEDNTINEEPLADNKLITEQQASFVSNLLKNSAERVAANTPIILNRDSKLFKNYWQQRVPRRAPNQVGLTFFRDETRKTTPKPHYIHDGSTEYKASTVLPPLEQNEVELYPAVDKIPVKSDFKSDFVSQDEPVESLEQQLIGFEHYQLQLPLTTNNQSPPPIGMYQQKGCVIYNCKLRDCSDSIYFDY
jgi:hypothetical protein